MEEMKKEYGVIVPTEELKERAEVDDIFITQATANGFMSEPKIGKLKLEQR